MSKTNFFSLSPASKNPKGQPKFLARGKSALYELEVGMRWLQVYDINSFKDMVKIVPSSLWSTDQG